MIESPSGKQYIGITASTLSARWRAHRAHANRSLDGALQKAILKYGADNMSVKIMAIADNYQYLKDLEVKAIAAFNTKVPNGYNLTNGGDGVLGVIVTEESRQRRSQAQLKSFADVGRKAKHLASQNEIKIRTERSELQKAKMMDADRRENIAKAMQEKWQNPEFIAKMKARKTKGKIDDGLSRSQRYRIKNLDAYQKNKREYAKTEEQKQKRTAYMRIYREKQRAKKLENET
tara:strand:+ start:150 stop:848 length:699 start_codon:yes stop_codon:yes gene_type:complete